MIRIASAGHAVLAATLIAPGMLGLVQGDFIEEAAREIGATVSVQTTQLQPAASTAQDHPAAATLARVVAAVDGGPARFELCAGILETRWYAQLGVPAFGYGPGRLDVSHGPDELIEELAMRRCAAVYALYAGEMLSA